MDGIDISHTSSDSTIQDDDLKIKGAAARSQDEGFETRIEKDASPETCTICLESISERAVAAPCNHLTFDFICLVQWLQERSTCPLCNTTVIELQYDWRSPNDYKTYRVPKRDTETRDESAVERSRRRRGQDFVRRRSERWASRSEQSRVAAGEDPALERRRQVYRERLFSLRVGANRISQYRDFTTQDIASSAELQSRVRMFLRRELKVFSFLNTAVAPRGGNREFLIEYTVAILKTNELKGANGHAEDLLADYLGKQNAGLLLHELEAWLRSPYLRLEDWDAHVQYAGDHRAAGSKNNAAG